MEINFNGLKEETTKDKYLSDVLELKGLTSKTGIAVAVNQKVVPRNQWGTHALKENDIILVIKATQGG